MLKLFSKQQAKMQTKGQQTIRVAIPKGMKPGQKMKVQVPGESPRTATIPPRRKWVYLKAGQAKPAFDVKFLPIPSGSTMAENLSNLSPDQLRRQAQATKSMPPDQFRRMYPQFANMNDAQILETANPMEMMASSNTAMIKTPADKMKNMNPEELQKLKSQLASGGKGAPVA